MRIVVVGGGIAGLTVAAAASRSGHEVTVLERSASFEESGYGLGLYRPGGRVLERLGVLEAFHDAGLEIGRYALADEHGDTLQAMDLSAAPAEIRPYIMIPRTELVQLLASCCTDVDLRMGSTVRAVDQSADRVDLALDDGTPLSADVVVVADGRSGDRRWSPFQAHSVDCGWVYWTWWGLRPETDPDTLLDIGGPGWFFGSYPVRDKAMYAVALPTRTMPAEGRTPEVRDAIHRAVRSLTRRRPEVATLIDGATGFYPWRIRDTAHDRWSHGRLVLCGDAAAGAIPTAGSGASHALLAASALTDELTGVGATGDLTAALRRYEARCRPPVDSSLRSARQLARVMLCRGRTTVWARDVVMRRYPPEKIINNLTSSVTQSF